MRLFFAIFPLALGLHAQNAPVFEPASNCSMCHSRIKPPARAHDLKLETIGAFALWTESWMAQAARDLYWRTQVALETRTFPAHKAAIEDKCLQCHAPLQQYPRRAAGAKLSLDELDDLGRGGVSCTVCHQIQPKLGTKASFSGGFEIGPERLIFGPHANPFSMPMEHHTAFRPAEGKHILESSLCGTCHTVLTHPANFRANAPAEFYEQAPFLEWMASDYPAMGLTCQRCHVPPVSDANGKQVESYIAHNPMGRPFPPTRPRAPFGLHWFFGANVQMPRLLAAIDEEWRAPLERLAARNREFLETAVALDVKPRLVNGGLEIAVQVCNSSGHKLPTALPSRRLWLRLTVLDRGGRVLFESGAWDPRTGSLVGGDQQPHYERIRDPRQVMIYEAEYGDANGKTTYSFIEAARFIKDNRILPSGWDLDRVRVPGVTASALAAVAIAGDPDFVDGSDQVIYDLDSRIARQAALVRVEACWQSVKPAHAEATLLREGGAVAAAYRRNSGPVIIAKAETAIPEKQASAPRH